MASARAGKGLCRAGLLGVLLAATPVASHAPYLSEAAIREAIVGQTLDGHYGNGMTWVETYQADGRLDYREASRAAKGAWSFRPGGVFCTFYDPSPSGTLSGGCWQVLRSSANCFEFYVAAETPSFDAEEGMPAPSQWNARGWRRGEPSTCGEKPSV